MLDDANQEVVTETPAEAPDSQPVQGGETPAATPSQEDTTPQGQGSQQSPMIPKWRFDQINEQLKAERQARLQMQQPAVPQPQQQAPQEPKPDDFPTYEAYIDARAEFKAERAAEAKWNGLQQQQQQAAQQQTERARIQTAEANWTQKADEAIAKYPDFEQRIYTSPSLTNAHALAVLKASPVAGDLAYHLASNHDLVNRLNGMHPLDAAAELGRIEGKLNGSSGQPKSKPSAGIPVITPVGAGQKHGTVDPYATDTSVEDYIRATRPPPRRK